ncbi:hypothetical protein [Dickeya oryzae]|uniref:hypothetical protein n=1 Tax=Dickeya oryzae TaxID=1240404 RepID=UPI001AECE466|nr:hypothetical protein [Dickeya oryzae]MBP2851344.1 hypothetical protein [Dickeya oryzae]
MLYQSTFIDVESKAAGFKQGVIIVDHTGERMCNCHQLPATVLNSDTTAARNEWPSDGALLFPLHFQPITAEQWEPTLEYGNNYYRCLTCGQYWYLMCSPDAYPEPEFGIKLSGPDIRLTATAIIAKKAFIALLAHNGFDERCCAYAGCGNLRLKGRSVCQWHWLGTWPLADG